MNGNDGGHLPLPGMHHGIRKRDFANRREQESHGVVGDFVDAIIGNFGDDDAPFGGRGNIDVIDSDSEPRNNPAARHLPDHLRGDFGVGGQQRIGVPGHPQNRLGL